MIFDSTTYSRDIALLPTGHLYAANSGRDVGDLLGFANTEGVMQQGQLNDEIQRALAASDVVGIRYAESGIDELQGTADDYDLVLDYVVWDGNPSDSSGYLDRHGYQHRLRGQPVKRTIP